MKSKFEELMMRARELHQHINTDWAEEHQEDYDTFADTIEDAYFGDEITAKEHDDLALEAFYDYSDFYYYE